MSASSDPDMAVRLAAFEHLRRVKIAYGSPLPWSAISEGFKSADRDYLFASRAEGIFRPLGMSGVLSLRTVVPKPTRRVWYADQGGGDDRVRAPSDVLPYSFTGADPGSTRNRWLHDAMVRSLPLIYFFGVAPGMYEPLFPIYVAGWDPERLSVTLALGAGVDEQAPAWTIPDVAERRYAMRHAKMRLHQAMFREQVVDAYNSRCAFSGLPEKRLLEAAHIVQDGHETLGQPDVRNGVFMSSVHHAAYDAGLIGIDPGGVVHVARSLMEMHDGPLLEGMKQLSGTRIRMPDDVRLRPDPMRLEQRFAQFKA